MGNFVKDFGKIKHDGINLFNVSSVKVLCYVVMSDDEL